MLELRQSETAQEQVRQSYLAWLAQEDGTRARAYVVYREYYDGDHSTQLTKRQRRYLQVKMGEEFNDNYCPVVVDALAERLAVTGFDAGGQSELLWEWWGINRMDALQGTVHLSAVRDGDTYLIVEWNNDEARPVFSSEPAFDGTEGVKVHYVKNKKSVIDFASKRWRIDRGPEAGYRRRMNLYFPDRIEKYSSDERQWEGKWRRVEEEGQPWPLPWVDTAGGPLGVPVIHFRHRSQGYKYGQSELKSVIPLQNALNKTVVDLLAAADTTGFPLFVMLGDDPSGLETAPGSWIYSLKPAGEISVAKIPAEDLQPLIRLKDTFAMEIARVSRTPVSYFQISGQHAAEGTLKQQEMGLIAKARAAQVTFGNAWEDVLAVARRLYNTFGDGDLDEEQSLSTLWRDLQTRNEKEHLETLKIKADLGVPTETLWAEMGYDAEKVAEMRAQQGEEMISQRNIGGELLRAFEGGQEQLGEGLPVLEEGEGESV